VNLVFSFATDSDFELLLEIRIQAMRESLERLGRFDPKRARERFQNGYSPAHTRHIWFDGSRAGFFVLKPVGRELLLDHLYILPQYQRRGIGTSVLRHVFSEADEAHLPIKVGALRESESNGFYLRNGFRLVEQGEWDLYYIRQG